MVLISDSTVPITPHRGKGNIENDDGVLDFGGLGLTELFNIQFSLPIFISGFIHQSSLAPCFYMSYRFIQL